MLALSPTAWAMPTDVISVGGDDSNFLQVNAGESAGVAFSLDGSLSGAEVIADILCRYRHPAILVG